MFAHGEKESFWYKLRLPLVLLLILVELLLFYEQPLHTGKIFVLISLLRCTRRLCPRVVAMRTLIHPNQFFIVNFYRNHIVFETFFLNWTFSIWTYNSFQMLECRIVFQVRIHHQSRRVFLTHHVFVHNRILSGYRLLVGAFATREDSGLLTINRILVDRVKHISAGRTELHLISYCCFIVKVNFVFTEIPKNGFRW